MYKTSFNEFGSEMIENRPTMGQLDLDEMTKEERKGYLSICDEVASTAFNYMSTNNPDLFPAFRTALHKLFVFVGTETRILSLDAYSVRFIPAVVPYKVVKSKKYKDAEKEVRTFKKAIEWACIVSEADISNPEAVLFPKAVDFASMENYYYVSAIQDYYNACVKFFKESVIDNGHDLQLKVLKDELTRLESIRDAIGEEKWQCYKDFKNPMLSTGGKKLNHVPASIRKNIEDTMADLLSARALMTTDQLEKEEAQVKGGRKQNKDTKEAKKAESANK